MKSIKFLVIIAFVTLSVSVSNAQIKRVMKPTIPSLKDDAVAPKPAVKVVTHSATTSTNIPLLKHDAVIQKPVRKVVASGGTTSTVSSFFKTKYTNNQVWEISPDYKTPTVGTTKEVYIKGPACKNTGPEGDYKIINWGKNNDRYMMISLEKEGISTTNSDGTKETEPCRFTVKLYEHDGTLVEDEYERAIVVAVGDKGFELQIEACNYSFFFSKTPIKESDVIKNHIAISLVENSSQLNNIK